MALNFQSLFLCAKAAVSTEQDSVIINALVPQETPPEPAPGGGGSVPVKDVAAPVISNISVSEITFESAKISWDTDELSIPQVNYGKTFQLEKTYIGESFTLKNTIFLEGLSQGTTYFFEIIAIDRAGNRTSMENLNFITLSPRDNIAPQNASGLKATSGDSSISLTWKNPHDPDFDKVVIARSELFYPKNEKEGLIVYSGKDESFSDSGLSNGTKYYYSVFSFDFSQNMSSGAVASATPEKAGAPKTSPTPEKPKGPEKKPDQPKTPEPTPKPSPDMEKLTLNDFIFTQDGKIIDHKDGKINIDPEKKINISIDTSKIPSEVGTIMIILTKENEEFSYLMRKSEDGATYSASIKLSSAGLFDITIVLLDQDNNIIKAITGNVSPVSTIKTPQEKFSALNFVFPILILLLILIAYKIAKKIKNRRKKRKEQNGV